MIKYFIYSLLIAFMTFNCNIIMGQTYTPEDGWRDAQISQLTEKSIKAQQRIEWWREARFGMFIHWNPSSLSASEISWSKQFYNDIGENLTENPRPDAGYSGMKEHTEWLSWFKPPVPKDVYDNLYKSFYPGMFSADKIVASAKKAGMKYIIMVSKHHDGFCMWNSKYTDFDIMSTPFRRDILKEMADATRKAGLKFGIYYSQRDWHHPDYKPESMSIYNSYMRNQLKELLTNYGEISVLFFDSGEWKTWELWEGDKLFKMAYELQPNIIINDRCGVPGDYTTPEQKIGGFNNTRSWESCMTLTGFWSWHGFQTPVVPYEACLKYLISCAGGDGNLLMNIGPMPTGQIDPREDDRLKKVGEWLSKNGESIYGTKGGVYYPSKNLAATYKGTKLFLHLLNLEDKRLMLPTIKGRKIVKAYFLANKLPVEVMQVDENYEFTLPKILPDLHDTVVVVEFDKNLDGIGPIKTSFQTIDEKKP